MRPARMRWFDLAIAIGLPCALLAPGLDHLARPASARSTAQENRRPRDLPPWPANLASISAFPPAFAGWFDDRLGLRDVLMRARQTLDVFVLGVDPSPTLLTGRDGWLFFGSGGALESFRGIDPFRPGELEYWIGALTERRRWCAARGIEYVFAIAPNKEQVYTGHWPGRFTRVGPTRLDQFLETIAGREDLGFVDLRPALREEARHDRDADHAYHPLGSHWTRRGAWAACNRIAQQISARWPAVQPIPRERIVVEPDADPALWDSMADTTYIADRFAQQVFSARVLDSQVERTTPTGPPLNGVTAVGRSAELPRILFVHDSFGPSIVPYVAEQASWMLAFPEYQFPREIALSERVDVVLELMTERGLSGPPRRMSPDVDVLSTAQFAALEPLGGAFDVARAALPAARGAARVERVEESGADALALHAERGDATFEFPIPTPAPGHELALRIEITSPAPAELAVFYRTRDSDHFDRLKTARVGLRGGRAEVCFVIRAQGLHGSILLAPSGPRGRYVLHALETRAARP